MKIREKDLELIQEVSKLTSPEKAVRAFLKENGIKIKKDTSDFYHRMARSNWDSIPAVHSYIAEDAWLRSLTSKSDIELVFWYNEDFLPVDELT
jgi:hypothetical protein